jgi:hypothetical protein
MKGGMVFPFKGSSKSLFCLSKISLFFTQAIRKSLLWEYIKTQPRFQPFQDKIVHLILDDAQALADPDPKAIFAVEGLQEKARWESFLQWNEHTAFFRPEDLVDFWRC